MHAHPSFFSSVPVLLHEQEYLVNYKHCVEIYALPPQYTLKTDVLIAIPDTDKPLVVPPDWCYWGTQLAALPWRKYTFLIYLNTGHSF